MVHKRYPSNQVEPANGTRPTEPTTNDDNDANQTPEATNFQRAVPQFLAVGVKNLLLFGYGMTLGFPTIVIPAIQGGEGRDPHGDIVLNLEEISWFSSINLLCVPLGCIFSGIFTQPIGKRRAMQMVNIPIMAAFLLFHFSTNIYHLYAGLCLAGLMGGLMEAPVLTYVAEVTEPRYRGMLAASGSACVISGVFVQFLLGSLFKWRTIAAMSLVFPAISITALFFVPESPHWLISKGRFEEAQQALAWLRGWVPVAHIQQEYREIYDSLVVKVPAEQKTSGDDGGSARQSYWRTTIRRYGQKSFLLPYALITLTFFIGHFSGKTTLQTYAVQIFHTLKAPIDKYYATVLLGAVEIAGTLFCVGLVHYTGKRPLVLISTIGCGLCFFGTATYAWYLDQVPGVVVENVVANVSAVQVIREESLGSLNVSLWDITARNFSDDLLDSGSGWPDLFDENVTVAFDAPSNGSGLVEVIPLAVEPLENVIPDILLRIPNTVTNRYSWVPLTLLLMAAFFAHMGIKLIPWMLIGEIFPAAVRSGASGISGGTGYVFAFLTNKLFLSMLATLTMPGTFWLYSIVALVGAFILYFVLPETEGRTLMDIERTFIGGAGLLRSDNAAQQRQADHIRTPSPPETDAVAVNGMELKQRVFQKNLEQPARLKNPDTRARTPLSAMQLEVGEPRTEMTHL